MQGTNDKQLTHKTIAALAENGSKFSLDNMKNYSDVNYYLYVKTFKQSM